MAFERPPADPAKLSEAWRLWADSNELPGRTMADLKIGGLDLFLEALAEDHESGASLLEIWQSWEKGRLTPEAALGSLTETGLAELVAVMDAQAPAAE